MQKRIMILVGVTVLVLSFVSQAFSMGDRSRMKKKSPVSRTSQTAQAAGDVVATDIAKSTITISTKESGPLTFVLHRKARLSKGSRNITLLDVRKGDFAKVTYETFKKKNIAKSINLEAAPATPSSSQSKKKY